MRIDVQTFMDTYASNKPISINGIALGSPMAEIPYLELDGIDPNVSYSRSTRNEKVFRIHEDGREEEVYSGQRYMEVEHHGGWLRSGDISWYIKDKIVQRFVIRGAGLSSFSIKSEKQIVKRFGRPDFKSMSITGLEYHYFAPKLVLVWSGKSKSLESIMVGDFSGRQDSPEEDARNGTLYIAGIKRIFLVSLEQTNIYDGLLEGLPTAERNDEKVRQAITDARARSYSNVHLIEPARKKLEFEGRYPFGEPEALPSIRCIADYRSIDPARDENSDGSSLTIVWFQDTFALPIDEGVREKIESLDWDELAMDYQW